MLLEGRRVTEALIGQRFPIQVRFCCSYPSFFFQLIQYISENSRHVFPDLCIWHHLLGSSPDSDLSTGLCVYLYVLGLHQHSWLPSCPRT